MKLRSLATSPMSNNELPQSLPLSDAERKLMDKTPDAAHEVRVQQLEQRLSQLPEYAQAELGCNSADLERALLCLELAGLMLDLNRKTEAYPLARHAVDIFIEHKRFEDAALACQYVYLTDGEDALAAAGQAAWLAVTYPIDPRLTANILTHIVDETPDDSDGGAVAAATAHYIADLRSDGADHKELTLFTGGVLARVALRHSDVKDKTFFDLWVERLELDQPEKFLVRLRNVIDVMVQTDWWFDHEKLRNELPDQDEN